MARQDALDDSLDVVAAHGVGGTVGALLTGVFAQKALNGVDATACCSAIRHSSGSRRWRSAAAIVYSGVMSFVLLKLIGAVMPLRADAHDETAGLDLTQHGEEAYVHGEGSMSSAIRPGAGPTLATTGAYTTEMAMGK